MDAPRTPDPPAADSEPTGAWPAGTLLARLGGRERAELLRLGVRRDAAPGAVLLRQGTREAYVILIQHGVTKVTSSTADGHTALLAIRVAGDLVGEMAALNDRPRSATVTACGRCTYRVVTARDFRTFLTNHPTAALRVAGMVADRLEWANELRVDFASYPTRVRLARVILTLAHRYGRATSLGTVVEVQLTQPELASLCGAAEITVQQLLRDFRQAGLLDTGYRRFTVRDASGLRQVGRLR